MKKFLAVLLIIAFCLSVCACGESSSDDKADLPLQPANFGTVVRFEDFEIIADSDVVFASQLNGDYDQHDEFLTTDMTNYGDSVVCDSVFVSKEGQKMVVVSFSLKSTAQSKVVFDGKVALNYNNGYEYVASETYYTMGSTDGWHEYVSLELSPLTTVICKATFDVPEEVETNTSSPLKLIIANQEYTIR